MQWPPRHLVRTPSTSKMRVKSRLRHHRFWTRSASSAAWKNLYCERIYVNVYNYLRIEDKFKGQIHMSSNLCCNHTPPACNETEGVFRLAQSSVGFTDVDYVNV